MVGDVLIFLRYVRTFPRSAGSKELVTKSGAISFRRYSKNEIEARDSVFESWQDYFDDPQWISEVEVYAFAMDKTCNVSTEKEQLSTRATQAKEKKLIETVHEHASTLFDATYEGMANQLMRSREFRSENERHFALAKFILKPIKESCELALPDYATFFGGNFTGRVEAALVQFFRDRDAVKAKTQQA